MCVCGTVSRVKWMYLLHYTLTKQGHNIPYPFTVRATHFCLRVYKRTEANILARGRAFFQSSWLARSEAVP